MSETASAPPSFKYLKYLLIALGLTYLIFPRDVLPDALGLAGRIDDLLLIGFLYWKYRSLLARAQRYEEVSTNEQNSRSHSGQSQPEPEANHGAFDPYQVLELSRTASEAEIRTQYKKLAAQYHPDKVNHLGEELRDLAHQKMIEIQRAYEMLR